MMQHSSWRAGLGLALVALVLSVAWSPAQAGEGEKLTNIGVMQLCELGLGDEVVIAKIKQAEAVDFQLEIDNLATLKAAGVSGPVIAAMLERATPPGDTGHGGGAVELHGGATSHQAAEVVLETEDEDYPLTGMYGHYSMTHAFITVLAFMNYEGLASTVRTTDKRPEFLVTNDKNPKGIYFVVKAEVDDDDGVRSVKAGQMSMYNMQSFLKPDEDWTFSYSADVTDPNVWRLTLDKDLPPGEYGLWKAAGSDPTAMNAYLFDFAIEK